MDNTEKILSVYCKLGFHLFPVKRETKRPAIKDNLNLASTDMDQIKEWMQKFPDCNWGLSLAKSRMVAVDVDWAYGGMESWLALIDEKGEPETLKAISGSGGFHYLFKSEIGEKFRREIQKGIDVKHNGYVLVYPSVHQTTGNYYKWENWKKFGNKIARPSNWLLDLIKKDARTGKSSPVYKFGNDHLSNLVKELKKFDLDYHEWTQAGMAIHSADPSDNGLALFLELTQGPSFEEGDLEKAEAKWEGFSDREDGISSHTLGYFIREKGGIVPNPHYQEDIDLFKRSKIEEFEKAREANKGFYKAFNRLINWSHDSIVEEFNKMGYAFLKDGSMTPFLKVFKDEDGDIRIQKMSEKGFALETAPYQYARINETAMDIKPAMTPAYREYLESTGKKTYTDIVFKPNAKSSELNLWTPIQFEPDFKADCSEIVELIHRSLCNNDEVKSEWLLDWLAHIVQKPEEKATVVPVLISEQGAGKGLLMDYIMKKILGNRYTAVNSADELTAKFNAKLSKKFLTFIDEATWRGDHKEDGILKRFTASPTMTIEEKFGASYDMENFSRYLIASNNPEAVAMEKGNRRYVVIEANDKLANDLSFFGPIADKIKNTNETKIIQAFYAFLLARDLSKFNPFKILEGNMDGRLAKIKTAGVVAQFWEDVLFENPMGGLWEERGLNMTNVWDAFSDFKRDISSYERSISAAGFWTKTRGLVKNMPSRVQKRLPGTSKKARFIPMSPGGLAESFSNTMQINFPESFDEEEFYEFGAQKEDLGEW